MKKNVEPLPRDTQRSPSESATPTEQQEQVTTMASTNGGDGLSVLKQSVRAVKPRACRLETDIPHSVVYVLGDPLGANLYR